MKRTSRCKECITVTGIALFTALLFYLSGIGCPFRFFFGITCPGCGITRACVSALLLDFSAAFYFHPLWFAVPCGICCLAVFYILGRKRLFYSTLFVLGLAFITVYFIRLILGCEITAFAVKESFLYKIFIGYFIF